MEAVASIHLEAQAKFAADNFLLLLFHYENTPIQIYRKFHLQKLKIFR